MNRFRLPWLSSARVKYVLVALATALPTAVVTGRRIFDWRYATWAESSRLLAATLVVVLPVVTLAVLVIIGRRQAAGPGIRPSARIVYGTIAATLAGWIAGAAPLLIWSIRTAEDSPHVLFPLASGAWVAATAAAAAVAALTVRRRPALVGGVLLWVVVIGAVRWFGDDSRWLTFLPFMRMSAVPSGEVGWNSWLAAVRIVVATVIGFAALSRLRADRTRRTTVAWATVGVVAAAIVAPVPALVRVTPHVVCQDGRVRVCVMAEFRPDLPAVHALVERTAAAAGPELFPFTLASEVVANSPTSIQLAVGAQRKASNTLDVAGQLAASIARIDRCAPPEDGPADPAYRLVAFWAVQLTGIPPTEYAIDPALAPRLDGWRQRPAEITAALGALSGRLDSCTLTMADLPPAGTRPLGRVGYR